MTATELQIGDVVIRAGARDYGDGVETGDVVEKNGERCRVAWRDRQVSSFYRPEEKVTRPGKRTWVRQTGLAKVAK